MISKAKLKFFKSLQIKKYRKQQQQFIIEGKKLILEAIQQDVPVIELYLTQDFYEENQEKFQKYKVNITTSKYLKQAGTLINNSTGLAVLHTLEHLKPQSPHQEFVLLLDEVKDPGNLGTIIRIADWYGIQKIVCSENCVDIYNPKVVQASMGSLFRIKIYYTHLQEYLENNKNFPIYATFLEGQSIYETDFAPAGFILMGSESHGISESLLPYIQHKITIPSFGNAESLNVAIATAIVCDNWRRSV